MNIEAFRKERQILKEKGPFEAAAWNRLFAALNGAAGPEHVSSNLGEGMLDELQCTCGWKSKPYWDGADIAWDEWIEHVADSCGLLPKKCPCGKKYIPADGESACHTLTCVTD